MMDITLYEFSPTRSARCRWTLAEADLDYTSIERRELVGSDELKKIHPLGKLPAAVIDGNPIIESSAICTFIADQVPEKKLIAPSGTWERALHDQWVSFGLSELEAYTWSTARNTFILPEEKHVPAIIEQNGEAFKAAAAVLDEALKNDDYLVGNRFSVTDIILGFTVAWGWRQGLVEGFQNVEDYMERLMARPLCPYEK